MSREDGVIRLPVLPSDASATAATAKDGAESIVAWAKAEVSGLTTRLFDLAKFFATLSTGTIGLIVTLEKVRTDSGITPFLILSTLALTVSILVVLMPLVYGPRWQWDVNTDLHDAYHARLEQSRRLPVIWFVLWVTGLGLGMCAVLRSSASVPASGGLTTATVQSITGSR